MRLFVALEVPDETRRALRAVIDDFSAVCRGARWARPEGIHVTLKFIGHIEDRKLPAVQEALSPIHRENAIHIAIRQFGFFPNEKHPRIFFVGIEGGEVLAGLSTEIEDRLEPIGIAKEGRAFRPHLTLARFKTSEGLPQLHKKLASLPSQDFGGSPVAEFHLYQSVLQSGGAMYVKLSTYSFTK